MFIGKSKLDHPGAQLRGTGNASTFLLRLKSGLHQLSHKHRRAAWLLIAALSLLLLCSSINTARAQGIAFDSSSDDQTGNGLASSLTFSHTVAGANRLLIVGISIRNTSSQTVGSVTYAGTAMTLVGAVNNGTDVRVELWKLVAPATGANNVVVTIAGGGTARFVAGAASFTGVNQTTPHGSFFSTTGNSAAPSVNVTSVASGELVIDTLALVTKTTTASAGAGQTQRWNNASASGGDANNARGAASTEPGPGSAGTVTMSWSLSATRQWAIGAVALKPELPDLTITKSHIGNFTQGQVGATYTITATNSGTAATTGDTVTVTDLLPAGLTATAISGTGWTCVLATLICTRSNALAAGASYPAITLTVDVALTAPLSLTNVATVSGGGEINTSNNTANDLTAIEAAPPPSISLVKSVDPGGAQVPGTDLQYTIVYTNDGGQLANNFIIVDPNMGNALPAERVFQNVDFKIGSLTSSPGSTGLVAVFEYSDDGGTTWTYTPVSGAGGAAAGYDRLVTNIRWTFTGSLSHTAPNNSGSVRLTVRIR